ncbi:MAG: UPF0158 family protein [bacterium]
MRKLFVQERDLLFALTNQMPETAHYLDLETGDVIPVFNFNRDEILARVREKPERFIRLVPQTKSDGFKMMQRFIDTVSRQDLRAKLTEALKEGRRFGRFRIVLSAEEEEFKRWQQFRVMTLTEPLKKRLQERGFELVLVRDDTPTCAPLIEDETDEED